MTTYVCGAIFGPDGSLVHVEPSAFDLSDFAFAENDTWASLFEGDYPASSVKGLRERGFRFALVTVTEQTPSVPAPPPPGTRFDEEGVPMETGK